MPKKKENKINQNSSFLTHFNLELSDKLLKNTNITEHQIPVLKA